MDTALIAAREASYPSPFPKGWFRLLSSKELKAGRILRISALGRQFVTWRDEAGAAQVLDAFCPHLGASLEHGSICEGKIQCPFHGWRMDGEGCVTDVPYSPAKPRGAAGTAYEVAERYGMICIWFDPAFAGRGKAEPDYPFIDLPELESDTWTARGTHEPDDVGMHLIEFSENSADFAHFQPLHGQAQIPWTQIEVPGVTLSHDASWESDPELEHVAWFRNRSGLVVRGKEIVATQTDVDVMFFGPGSIVAFRFHLPDGAGEVLLFQTHLPVAPLQQQVRFHWFSEKKVNWLNTWLVVGGWVSQWANDLHIWENKAYVPRPLLVAGDGPVPQMRSWFKQFYSDDDPQGGAPVVPLGRKRA